MSLNKEEVIDFLSNMPVIELSEMISDLEEKWGVSAAAAAVAVAGPAAGGAAAEEKTEFDVVLTSAGATKIAVIKEVRALTGLGLKEAKEMVDSAPKALKTAVPKDEADKMKEALEKAGATVELK